MSNESGLSFNFDRPLTQAELAGYLRLVDEADIAAVQQHAEQILLREIGNKVYFRGLVEASNICQRDCYYCGIRLCNKAVERFQLAPEVVLERAKQAKALGYASFVIQAGERQSPTFIDYIVRLVRAIKAQTRCDKLPDGLGITLSLGEQGEESYQRFFAAGAHRYLLRIETSNPRLFTKIHPPQQTLEQRIACLHRLRDCGFQVGSGVMIGLPEQTPEDLAADIQFFQEFDVDMIGMGPFIPDPAAYACGGMDQTLTCPPAQERVRLTLLMTALARIVLKDVNIAATTALQTLDADARIRALRFGANVMMPQLTPLQVRKNYSLYPKKPLSNEAARNFNRELEQRIRQQGRDIGLGEWGDAPHARNKRETLR